MSVTQALALLNGHFSWYLNNRNPVLGPDILKAKSARNKVDVLFLSMLNRSPTEEEYTWAMPLLKTSQRELAVMRVLLNSHEFMFIR